jgi:hypothetical protein
MNKGQASAESGGRSRYCLCHRIAPTRRILTWFSVEFRGKWDTTRPCKGGFWYLSNVGATCNPACGHRQRRTAHFQREVVGQIVGRVSLRLAGSAHDSGLGGRADD